LAKIEMEDNCLTPENWLTINFKGPNPFKAYHVTKDFLRKIWEVEAKDYWEREFRWSAEDDPIGFVCKSYVVKSLDRFTRVIVEVRMQGKQWKDPNKEGSVEIRISGFLKTSFGGNSVLTDAKNPLYRGLMLLYNKFFYWDRRRQYIELFCKRRLQILKSQYQEALNIKPS